MAADQEFREFRLTALEPPGYRPKPRIRVAVERIGIIGAVREWWDADGRLIGLAPGGLVLTRYRDGGWGTQATGWAPILSMRTWQAEHGLARISGTWPHGVTDTGPKAGPWWVEA